MISHAVISAFLARMPDPEPILAAYSISFYFHATLGSPIWACQFVAVSYIRDRASMRRLLWFSLQVAAVVTLALFTVGLTPVGSWLFRTLFGAGPEVADAAQRCTLIFSFVMLFAVGAIPRLRPLHGGAQDDLRDPGDGRPPRGALRRPRRPHPFPRRRGGRGARARRLHRHRDRLRPCRRPSLLPAPARRRPPPELPRALEVLLAHHDHADGGIGRDIHHQPLPGTPPPAGARPCRVRSSWTA